MKLTLGERLLRLSVKAPSGCWEWIGYRGSNGYGQVRWLGTTYPAHRASFSVFVRPLADDEVVDHLCRNHGCIRPLHLSAVSNMVNQERGMTKTARSRSMTANGRCRKRGHDLSVYGRTRGNGSIRCVACHAIDERARRARRRETEDARA